ncbi:DNA polymerase II [Shewanella sp. NIFS-20-20]|nr:DNA polymerase II [Shewanella sp. NIFS-20-20]
MITMSGRILSRHWRVLNGEGCAEYYLATANGVVIARAFAQWPTCFCLQQDEARVRQLRHDLRASRPLSLTNFAAQPLTLLELPSMAAMGQLYKQAMDVGVAVYETQFRPEQRFLMERFIHLDMQCRGRWLAQEQGVAVFEIVNARACKLTLPLSLVSLDIECGPDGALHSIGLYSDSDKRVLMIDNACSQPQPSLTLAVPAGHAEFQLQYVSDEVSLLKALCAWFAEFDPDIIIGWSVVNFDLSLLYRRAQFHQLTLTIGRAGQALSWKVNEVHRSDTLSLPGRVVLDGIEWLKAAFYQFERYSLEFVSQQLFGNGKLIASDQNKVSEINRLFREDKAALAQYNLQDCQLVWQIFEHKQLLEFAVERAAMTGLALGRVGASVAAFMHLYLPHLHRHGYVAPIGNEVSPAESPGGYVMESIPGIYQDIVVLDFKSLYPSIIRTFLIDPKGLVEGTRQYAHNQSAASLVPGFIGAWFSREKPILPALVTQLSEAREMAKQSHNQALSQAIKIIMNSLYGVLGSQGCVFHDPKLASSITLRGHDIMQTTRQWIEQRGFKVIYGDTDSTFVHLAGSRDIKATAMQLINEINQAWQDKIWQEFQLESFLELEFDAHYQSFFMPTLRDSDVGSKKRYVGASQHQGQWRLTFKGMEQVRSDWTPLAKDVQYQLYLRLFQGLDVEDYLKQVICALNAGQLDHKLILTKRLRRPLAQYSATASPHVKAAALAVSRSGDPSYSRVGSQIRYVMTIAGAEPVDYQQAQLDYQYYIDKQLKPISDPVLTVMKLTFDEISSDQLRLI